MTTMADLVWGVPCGLCGQPVKGMGWADGKILCNDGERPTCYTKWTRDGARPTTEEKEP